MKIWKLVSGILSIVLSVYVFFQSMMADMANSLSGTDAYGAGAGIIVAILLLAGGIVSIAVRNVKGKGGDISVIVLYGLAALVGFLLAGAYLDLYIWSAWCLVCAVLAVISLIRKRGE